MLDPEQLPGIGEPGSQGTPTAETRFLSVIQNLQRNEQGRPNLWEVYDAITTEADKIFTREEYEKMIDGTPLPPEKVALADEIRNVGNAFGIAAYPFMDGDSQQAISWDVHGHSNYKPKKREDFTLTQRGKKLLTQITTLTGVPDKPDQLTYSFSSIPRIVGGSAQIKG